MAHLGTLRPIFFAYAVSRVYALKQCGTLEASTSAASMLEDGKLCRSRSTS